MTLKAYEKRVTWRHRGSSSLSGWGKPVSGKKGRGSRINDHAYRLGRPHSKAEKDWIWERIEFGLGPSPGEHSAMLRHIKSLKRRGSRREGKKELRKRIQEDLD